MGMRRARACGRIEGRPATPRHATPGYDARVWRRGLPVATEQATGRSSSLMPWSRSGRRRRRRLGRGGKGEVLVAASLSSRAVRGRAAGVPVGLHVVGHVDDGRDGNPIHTNDPIGGNSAWSVVLPAAGVVVLGHPSINGPCSAGGRTQQGHRAVHVSSCAQSEVCRAANRRVYY